MTMTDPIWIRAFRARLHILAHMQEMAGVGSDAPAGHPATVRKISDYAQGAIGTIQFGGLTGHQRLRFLPEVRHGVAACLEAMTSQARANSRPHLSTLGLLPDQEEGPRR